ncbi:MAG: CarD family transcriptional regulator [Clostridia bacterium]|nr:CarD family transcriptional regulator [Clostridia bacterium]
MYKIGDKISHPVHGAGIISDIETKEMLGEELDFYTIEIPANKMKIFVSTDKADEVGIRKILSKKEMDSVIKDLAIPMEKRNINWMERTRDNEAKLATRKISEVAKVYKELYMLDNEKGLSSTEKRIYTTAKQILASELSLVKSISNEQAVALMEDSLNKTFELK